MSDKQNSYKNTWLIYFNISYFSHSPLIALLTFLICISLLSSPLFAAEGFSEINNALFDTPHMQSIKVSGKLNYQYQKVSSDEKAKQKDSVTVKVTNISDDGHTDQAYEFFTGENNIHFQNRPHQRGNGIFMMFLERDVHELERLTKGSWRHFQRRIRWAMASTSTTKKEVTIDHQGKNIKGIQYNIKPYSNDKKSERYGSYANKFYTFTLSAEIPGTIYEVRTVVPKSKKWKEGDEVISDERITFTGFTPNTKN